MKLDTFINFNPFIFLLQKRMQVCETVKGNDNLQLITRELWVEEVGQKGGE